MVLDAPIPMAASTVVATSDGGTASVISFAGSGCHRADDRRGRGMTAADQSPPEKVAAPRESAADRSNWTVELRGSLNVRVPFEIAQDERGTVLSR